MKTIFLLDMDETLLDFPAAEHIDFFLTLKTFGVAPHEDMYARFHAINEGLWKRLERGELTREELMVRRFRDLFAEYAIGIDAEAVASAYYENLAEICVPYAGAKAFVAELARRGRVYLVTNGGAHVQARHIELAGFGPSLSGVFISGAMGVNKPSFAYAEAVKAGIPAFSAEDAILIGDSLTSDMVCAKRMGVDFLLYARRRPAGYFGPMASTYPEALGLLARL